ncbi:MAG: DUF1178 family protein [Alteraurantiacibacter sp.]
MIVFDLACSHGHQFEGWFGSSDDFSRQSASGLLSCPQCGCEDVAKAPMAPAVPVKGNRRTQPSRAIQQAEPSSQQIGHSPAQGIANVPLPREVQHAMRQLAEAQARALASSTWVGTRFADDARAMHYGERDVAPIHGEASAAEALQLIEEGIEVAPLPFPVTPPDELN